MTRFLRFAFARFLVAIGVDRSGPWVMGPCHCVNCGHRVVAVIQASSPCYDAETGVLDMLECSECGLFTMYSD